ncbi:Signal recognition particle-docking protein FtsY [Companilactobacillus mindensis DSM 14500]|uniref:Signal recognition particle receptor FtsY n=1 Tax=Companilactobacillus mindensis DSM 14500 TaxID=1423770 RepID=A0A0R1QTY1_9LACO|nr:signal recognition particle-docking protein FtsY [Companilactobacillus mindensis]KRL45586.1 Signal recognition particle-docking protein FtsY [Companilactobacillus mindensis DSM 14500]GEO78959.1 signal recognition particle receptor FtsY [Companilactobacillus mindensis]
MGLFDRIKKAFTGRDDSEDKEKKTPEETAPKTDQENVSDETSETKESTETPDSSSKDSQPVESTEKEPVDQEESQAPAEENTEPETAVKDNPVSETKEPEQPAEQSENVEPKTSEPEDTTEDSTPEKPAESVTEEAPIEPETTESEPEESESEHPEDTTEVAEEPKDDVKEYDEGLKKSRNSFSARFNRFMANFRSVDEDFFDDLEELLIESDVGYETAMRISDELREEVKLENAKKKSDVSNVIVKKLVDMYGEEGKEEDNSLQFSTDKTPTVFLFVGVNGAGKTTTVGKLAHRYQQQGKKVLLAAADTFRAGAIEQLQEWGVRDGVPVQASKAHTDPASVVYDAVERAVKEDFDILLVDTAGRLQNKEGLMRELEKIKRVITRELPDAPQEVLLVLDGSTGQNALSQAKQFNETTKVSGIVLTKLDGSSQGGIVLAIRNELHIPVKLVGLGEQMDDLRDFDPEKFIYGLFKELIVGASNK